MTSTEYQNLWDKINKPMVDFLEELRYALRTSSLGAAFVLNTVTKETDCEEFFASLLLTDSRNSDGPPTFALSYKLHDSDEGTNGANVSLTLDDVAKQETLWSYRPENYSKRVWTDKVSEMYQRVGEAPYEDVLKTTILAMNRVSSVPPV